MRLWTLKAGRICWLITGDVNLIFTCHSTIYHFHFLVCVIATELPDHAASAEQTLLFSGIQKHREIKTRQAYGVNKAGCFRLFPGYDFYA